MGSMSLRQSLPVAFLAGFFVLFAFSLPRNKRAKNLSPGLLLLPQFFSPGPPLFRLSVCFGSASRRVEFCRKQKAALCATVFFPIIYITIESHKNESLEPRARLSKNRFFISLPHH